MKSKLCWYKVALLVYCTKWKCETLYTLNLRAFYRFCLGNSYMQCVWRALHAKNYNYKDNHRKLLSSTATVANGVAFREIQHTSPVHLVHPAWGRTSTGRFKTTQPFWIKQTVFERCFSTKTSGLRSPSIINIHFSADAAGACGACFVRLFAQGWRSSVGVLPSVWLQLTVVFLGADRPLQSCLSSERSTVTAHSVKWFQLMDQLSGLRLDSYIGDIILY